MASGSFCFYDSVQTVGVLVILLPYHMFVCVLVQFHLPHCVLQMPSNISADQRNDKPLCLYTLNCFTSKYAKSRTVTPWG